MTARVTSSASVSLGAIPTAGRHGARWGCCCSRSSMVTYSAVARVSRSASTGPPGSTLGLNADHGHPPFNPAPLGINRLGSAVGEALLVVGVLLVVADAARRRR